MNKKPKMTLKKLALMMGRGFGAVDKRFDAVEIKASRIIITR